MGIVQRHKELGHKEFMRRWKEGIHRIKPDQFIKSEIFSLSGSIIGTLVAVYIFIFIHNSFWIIAVIMGFNLVMLGSSLLQKIQQLKTMRDADSMESFGDLQKQMMGGEQTGTGESRREDIQIKQVSETEGREEQRV